MAWEDAIAHEETRRFLCLLSGCGNEEGGAEEVSRRLSLCVCVCGVAQAERCSATSEKLWEWAKQQTGSQVDGRTYAELTRIVAWDGEAEAAEELLGEMWGRGLHVDSLTLFMGLAAFAKAGR